MNKKVLTKHNPDLFPFAARRANLLHPALVGGNEVNLTPSPAGVYLDLSGDFVSDWVPGGSLLTPEDYCSVGVTPIKAPDGSMDARKIIEADTTQTHFMSAGVLHTTNAIKLIMKYKYVLFAKAAERSRIALYLTDSQFTAYSNAFGDANSPYPNGVKAVFDLVGGTVAVAAAAFGNGWEAGIATITQHKRGWYRCTIEGTAGIWAHDALAQSKAVVLAGMYLDNGTGSDAESTSYNGDGVSGVYTWKANCLPSAAWDFTEEVFSDDFDDDSTIDVLNTQVPGFNWYVNMNGAFNLNWGTMAEGEAFDYHVANSRLCLHARGAMNLRHWLSIASDGGGAAGYIGNVWTLPFMIETVFQRDAPPGGAVTNVGMAYWTSSAEGIFAPVGGGWPILDHSDYNASELASVAPINDPVASVLRWDAPAVDFIGPSFAIQSSPYNITNDYTIDHTYAIMVFKHPGGSPTFPSGQRNVHSNSSFAGATPGSPGTLPTGVSLSAEFASAGLSVDVVSVTAGKFQFRIHGTVNPGNFNTRIDLNSVHSTAAGAIGPGQVWVGSLEFRPVSGSSFLWGSAKLEIEEHTSGDVHIDNITATISTFAYDVTALTRNSIAHRIVSTNCRKLKFSLYFSFATGQVVDSIYEIYHPQLERSVIASDFQDSSGSDPAVVQGLTLTQAAPYFNTMLVFFDGGHTGEVQTSKFANLSQFSPVNDFGENLNYPIILDVGSSNWGGKIDYIKVIK